MFYFSAATVAYTALALVVIGIILAGIFIYFYRSNNSRNNSFTLDLQSIVSIWLPDEKQEKHESFCFFLGSRSSFSNARSAICKVSR